MTVQQNINTIIIQRDLAVLELEYRESIKDLTEVEILKIKINSMNKMINKENRK